MRMKSNLCRFISAFAEESGGDWDQEINEEILGGSITIIEGQYTLDQHEIIFKQHQDHGNEPIDALFCVPPDSMMESSSVSDRLRTWGYTVWDGTSSDVRDTFPTTPQEHRVVRYESCRGLEGWTVVCVGLDRFYDNYVKYNKFEQLENLFDTPESFARRQASAWALIPLTRAIDHLVIQLDGPGIMTDICSKLFKMYPEFVTWRKNKNINVEKIDEDYWADRDIAPIIDAL